MVTIKRILFPIDFSECSYDVAPYVLSMTEKFEATVYLLYVARPPVYNCVGHLSA